MVTAEGLLSRKSGVLFSIDPDEPVLEAIQLMADHSIGAVLVMKGTELVGIVSERDYARKVVLLGRNSAETPVWQIMSTPVLTVGPADSVQHCMRLMTERRIRHLPVLDEGVLIGMVSIGDCVRAVIEAQQQEIDELKRYISS